MLHNVLRITAYVWPAIGVVLWGAGYIELWAAAFGFITWLYLLKGTDNGR